MRRRNHHARGSISGADITYCMGRSSVIAVLIGVIVLIGAFMQREKALERQELIEGPATTITVPVPTPVETTTTVTIPAPAAG